ncbi:hypothetical protein GTA62_18600 [Roseobacter sp. HKCCD9010]|uniref:hypothetical protein n=1 Tax=unclassified Roseobacter TaxID=196798 RepID=UPI001491DE47|nr:MULTISPECIES: hypothetical protein [unclassified Roseobacter]MBF9051930.1 hypothetical protein [Rhodobacterales bacterium HKCCD4356]NNV13923.1 hypothetical protein [Roseobacter sp. HKCCD7357]NNV18095.1 hypothetical protein [Roseobacter sp. HKCCD8768]NNV27555.1 hypothetical protein [Roseobacter sp. HKCCD8192]NNV31821.1 hypothetical protein [Roseobacter sp. HKCCD9061]
MQSSILKTLASIGLMTTTAPAVAQDPVPTTLAEGWAQVEAALAEDRQLNYLLPPGNVQAKHFRALFGDTVMISRLDHHLPGEEGLKIIFIGADGQYVWCSLDDEGRFTAHHEWRAELRRQRTGELIPSFNPNIHAADTDLPGLSPLYDAQSGRIIWYTGDRAGWWDWNIGHLQQRLPAVTWTLCPDFPSAASLGVGVNSAQTATTYHALVTQNPGRRIQRPDLVTPNAMAAYE